MSFEELSALEACSLFLAWPFGMRRGRGCVKIRDDVLVHLLSLGGCGTDCEVS